MQEKHFKRGNVCSAKGRREDEEETRNITHRQKEMMQNLSTEQDG